MDNSPQIKQVKLSECYKVDVHLELVSIFTPGMEKCFKPFPELIQRYMKGLYLLYCCFLCRGDVDLGQVKLRLKGLV